MYSNPTPKKDEDKAIVFNYPITQILELTKPRDIESINFWEVIENRRSTREFRELSLDEISNVLMSAKVKEIFVQNDGYILTHRSSASAGARHPIDIIVLSPILDSFKSFYYYNPFLHSLNKLGFESNIIEQFQDHINSILFSDKATIFWFVAHPDRTEAKYLNALSLIWRDAGALINHIQLVCTALNINSCALGSLGEPFISKLFSSIGEVYGVGGILLG
jgi:SagB-type dehydrogenase family enzyme